MLALEHSACKCLKFLMGETISKFRRRHNNHSLPGPIVFLWNLLRSRGGVVQGISVMDILA